MGLRQRAKDLEAHAAGLEGVIKIMEERENEHWALDEKKRRIVLAADALVEELNPGCIQWRKILKAAEDYKKAREALK
jgi:hypothetical protein